MKLGVRHTRSWGAGTGWRLTIVVWSLQVNFPASPPLAGAGALLGAALLRKVCSGLHLPGLCGALGHLVYRWCPCVTCPVELEWSKVALLAGNVAGL